MQSEGVFADAEFVPGCILTALIYDQSREPAYSIAMRRGKERSGDSCTVFMFSTGIESRQSALSCHTTESQNVNQQKNNLCTCKLVWKRQ